MIRTFTLMMLILWVFSLQSFAQKPGTVAGTVTDSTGKIPLEYATVSVFNGNDSVLVSYKLTDVKGAFKIAGLKSGQPYRLLVNAWQYEVYRKNFTVNAVSPDVNLGQIKLAKKVNMLGEVVVNAERPPILVRKDTIEFNAEAFKTLPSAVVEDLLKKLPGVTVGDNGILVNGKQVSRILVDGKEFFNGDQTVATKNLPANIIDKVQVSNDREAMRRDPDLTEGNIPQVINLKLKKAIKQGIFGKLYGGGGLQTRYEGGGIVNVFRDTTQVSLLGYSNNINRAGFSLGDINRIGGFNRSGANSMMIMSNGSSTGVAINGISFGGTGQGIQQSSGAGANFNTLFKNKMKLNLQYFFGQINSNLNQLTNRNQILGDSSLITNGTLLNQNRQFNHRLGGKFEWKPDTQNTLIIMPSVLFSGTRGTSTDDKLNLNQFNTPLNTSTNNQRQTKDGTQYNVDMDYSRDFKKRGRTLNLGMNAAKSNNTNDNFNYALNNFFQTQTSTVLDQLRNTQLNNFNLSANANYNEPLGEKLSLRARFALNYLDNENALFTFFRNPGDADYTVAVPQFTETVMQSGWRNNYTLALQWKPTKDLTIRPGAVFNTIHLQNRFIRYAGFNQDFNFFAPSFNLNYKSLNLDYTPSFREPDVSYIQPVANNTDPLFIQQGNPNLLPAKSHRINLNLYKYDPKSNANYNIYLGGTIQNNAVINARTVDANAVQTNTPVNASGIWSFYNGSNIGKDFKKASRQINLSAGYYVNYERTVIILNNISSRLNNLSFFPRGGVRLNFNDKFELSQNYSLGINTSKYADAYFTDRNFITHNSVSEIVVRYPKKVVFETQYLMTFNNQVAGFNSDIKLWNAAVTFLFLKNDRLQMKVSVNDILKSNVSRYRRIDQNFIIDTQTNALGRYGMATLTYNIQNFGGKVGGRERFFGF